MFQISRTWKPGAISKQLLSKLNKAKLLTSTVENLKPQKKSRKRVEDKPTLIVAKVNGEYHVEMQVEQKHGDTYEHYMPVKYKIASLDNEEKIRKRQRLQQRLINEKVKEVFTDPFHPEICQKTCMKAYKQAVGLLPFDPNNPDCTCGSEEEESVEFESCSYYGEDESGCSSLDVDWEIHFSPPIAHQDNM